MAERRIIKVTVHRRQLQASRAAGGRAFTRSDTYFRSYTKYSYLRDTSGCTNYTPDENIVHKREKSFPEIARGEEPTLDDAIYRLHNT